MTSEMSYRKAVLVSACGMAKVLVCDPQGPDKVVTEVQAELTDWQFSLFCEEDEADFIAKMTLFCTSYDVKMPSGKASFIDFDGDVVRTVTAIERYVKNLRVEDLKRRIGA